MPTTTPSRRAGLALALLLAAGASDAALADDLGPVVETDICAPMLEWYLAEHGLPPLAAMEERRWTYTVFKVEDGPDQISGYQFYGRPPACAEGTLVVNLWANCRVSNLYTRGDCRLPGVSRSWF